MSKITFVEGAAPPTPSTGHVVVYAKSDGFYYSKDDTGTETRLNENRKNSISAHIESVTNKTFTLVYKPATGGTIDKLHTILGGGTVTAKIQIGAVDVTGLTGLAVTTSNLSSTATGANTYNAGDEITMVLTAAAGASDLRLTLETTDA